MKKNEFFAACDKEYQEICEGLIILPDLLPKSGKVKVYIASQHMDQLQLIRGVAHRSAALGLIEIDPSSGASISSTRIN
jgi:hypothetical protein